MSSDSPVKHFVLAFLIALVVYLVLYRIIEDRRKRTGPWEVTFTNSLESPAYSAELYRLEIQ